MRALTRPDGRLYRPRSHKLRAHAWENPEAWREDDDHSGVIILGTLDPERARPFAVKMCRHWFGVSEAERPRPGWWRDGFENGERRWIHDASRGAPGVMFTAVDR